MQDQVLSCLVRTASTNAPVAIFWRRLLTYALLSTYSVYLRRAQAPRQGRVIHHSRRSILPMAWEANRFNSKVGSGSGLGLG